MGRAGGSRRVGAIALVLLCAAVLLPARRAPARTGRPHAAVSTPGTGVARPRVLYRPGQEHLLRTRLEREPYRTVFVQSLGRSLQYAQRMPGDMSIEAQRDLGRAAKALAFSYALNRTVVDGEIVPFTNRSSRRFTGALVQHWLTRMYDRSRLAVDPPLGGFDRDINTSEEIINYATAFDTLLGAGWDFGSARDVVVERLTSITGELYDNYVHPETAGGAADVEQNNHRTKVGAALAVAAVVLADDVPASRDWWDYGVLQVDEVLRFVLVTGDGAYGEGPYYYRYTAQNVLPLLRVWDRLLGGSSWTVGSVVVPAYLRHPLFARTLRWLIDTAAPNGTLAPIDDGNPGRSYYFGAVPAGTDGVAEGYWEWPRTPQPYETDGSVDLGPDTIVTYDDSIAPRAPTWSPTQFYVEGGTATFRSGWTADSVSALVLGEHDTASEFGRGRDGKGRGPQSHEHPDPGAYSLAGYGESLLLDPGYLSFTEHGVVNKAGDHSIVLVDGKGPVDVLGASLRWLDDPTGRPPADGQSTISDTFDAAGLDGATVTSRYGKKPALVRRRFLFADDRYLVVADRAASVSGEVATFSWPIQGNGGGTSGGTLTASANGGRWQIGAGRVDVGVGLDQPGATFTTTENQHEVPYGEARTHTELDVSVVAPSVRTVQLLYPSPSGSDAPTTDALAVPGAAATRLRDAAGDRLVDLAHRATSGTPLSLGRLRTDGSLALLDTHLDGRLRLAAADDATRLVIGATSLRTTKRGTLSVRLGPGRAEIVAGGTSPSVDVRGLGFVPRAIDGACGWTVLADGTVRIRLGRQRSVRLRSSAGNEAPAADPGADRRVAVGANATLAGGSSCDADGDLLTPRWRLVSAPAGSSWTLTGAGTWQPRLVADRPGPYRVRLAVSDSRGAASAEREVVVLAGPAGADGVDNDLDGLIDTDDPDLDAGAP